MIPIHFVGDGPRDGAMLPAIVEKMLGKPIRPTFESWKDLHVSAGSGYARKLKFAMRAAIDDNRAALVAVVDKDKSDSRLNELRAARAEGLQRLPLPTAVGEANPHGEAWLLDDQVAIRTVLKLPSDHKVPAPSKVGGAKGALHALISESPRRDESFMTLSAEIATALDPKRCGQREQTGFADFARDLASELRHL